MGEAWGIPLRVAPDREIAEEWALVLVTEGMSPSVWRTEEGFVLGVPAEQAEQAVGVLAAYESEAVEDSHEDEEPAGALHLYVGLAVGGALLAFFFFTGPWNPVVRWFERGSADAGRILGGEPWRTVTALTLHADIKHVLANAIAGALIVSAVCRLLGTGLGCALVLLAGAGGNFVNALVHGSLHVSVGASTSVFGAVGLLVGLAVARRHRRGTSGRRAWLPVAAGLALLAMLGTGPRVDLLAHLFGLAVGAFLGLGVAFAVPHPPGSRVQWTLGGAALVIVLYSWGLALS